MMQRNFLGTTIVVTCDAEGCGLCWVYDSFRGATFKDAGNAAAKVGWTIIRSPDQRLDLCIHCGPKFGASPCTRPAGNASRAGTVLRAAAADGRRPVPPPRLAGDRSHDRLAR